jgi:hypothetical protein
LILLKKRLFHLPDFIAKHPPPTKSHYKKISLSVRLGIDPQGELFYKPLSLVEGAPHPPMPREKTQNAYIQNKNKGFEKEKTGEKTQIPK